MKSLLLLLIFPLIISCMESEEPTPNNLVQYEVECSHCLVIFNDNMFEKRIVVSGKLEYSFENTSLDTASLTLVKSAIMAPIPARVVIKQGGSVLEVWDGLIEWDEVNVKAVLR